MKYIPHDPPDHYKEAVDTVLGLLVNIAPDLFELSEEGAKLTLPEGFTLTELLFLLENRKPGITEGLEMTLEAGRHPEQ